MEDGIVESVTWKMMSIEGIPDTSFPCNHDHWTLAIHFRGIRRVMRRSPDGIDIHSPHIEDHQNWSIWRAYSVAVSTLRSQAFSSLLSNIAEVLGSLDVPLSKRLIYGYWIIRSARDKANHFCGRGAFILKADLQKLITSIVQDGQDIDTLPIPEEHKPFGRGASKEAILRHLQSVRKGRELAGADLDTCSICLKDMTNEDELVRMPCNCKHRFHSPCIIRWLETSNSCPLCRYILED